MELSVAQRRDLVEKARNDPAFLQQLKQDGVRAIAAETGVTLPDGMAVHIIEEAGDGAFTGVLPREAALAEGLPEPIRARDAWENLLLATVSLDAEARSELLADPVGFARELAGNFPGNRLEILVENSAETYLVIDAPEGDELPDYALDFVSGGGGNPPCKTANGSSRSNQV